MKQYSKQIRACMRIVPAMLVVFAAMVVLFSKRIEIAGMLTPENGCLDVRTADFARQIYTIDNTWTHYPMVLSSDTDQLDSCPTSEHESSIPYATYRLELQAQPEQYLMLAGYSLDYSTRFYVDGKLVREVGKVADNAQEAEPRIDYMFIPLYTGESGRVELLCQYANFVHKEGGSMPCFYISEPENIQYMQEKEDLYALVLSGGLCLLALYFLLLSAVQGELQHFFLAITCVLMGFRNQNFYVVHLLSPDYNWAVAYRFLVWMNVMQLCALLLLLASICRVSWKNWAARIYVGAYVFITIVCFTLPVWELAGLSRMEYWVSAPFFAYLLFRLLRQAAKHIYPEDVLVLIGYGLLLAADTYESTAEQIVRVVTRNGAAPPWMLVFVLLLAVSIGLRSNRQQAALAESQRQRDMLAQLNQLKTDFLQQMAHELKTPLTVMSGYAQLTRWQLEQDAVDAGTDSHLNTISSEAQRLSALVSQLIQMANGDGRSVAMERITVDSLFDDAVKVCTPLLEKNGNRLYCSGGTELALMGNRDMLLQVLINLTINANKHTRGGTVTYTAQPGAPGWIDLRVQDTGTGISEQDVAHIFEKGYSADGGSGIGLYICRDVTELHGGRLTLEHTGHGGSVFRVELPGLEEESL